MEASRTERGQTVQCQGPFRVQTAIEACFHLQTRGSGSNSEVFYAVNGRKYLKNCRVSAFFQGWSPLSEHDLAGVSPWQQSPLGGTLLPGRGHSAKKERGKTGTLPDDFSRKSARFCCENEEKRMLPMMRKSAAKPIAHKVLDGKRTKTEKQLPGNGNKKVYFFVRARPPHV